MSKFRGLKSVKSGNITVEIGNRGRQPAFKLHIGEAASAFIVTEAEANSIADAFDEAIDTFESDPLFWENGSQ